VALESVANRIGEIPGVHGEIMRLGGGERREK
jgi:hypothetical protein